MAGSYTRSPDAEGAGLLLLLLLAVCFFLACLLLFLRLLLLLLVVVVVYFLLACLQSALLLHLHLFLLLKLWLLLSFRHVHCSISPWFPSMVNAHARSSPHMPYDLKEAGDTHTPCEG
jgi:hypothetical protein